MHKFLDMAVQYANEFKFDEQLDYYLCALIVRGGSVISVGYNKYNTNGFVEHYADMAKGSGRGWCLSTHAEMDAVLKARGKTDLRGTKIYVVRLKASGGVGMARPCPICDIVLQSYGIKRAIYTIDNEHYGQMKPGKNHDRIFRFSDDGNIMTVDNHPILKKA